MLRWKKPSGCFCSGSFFADVSSLQLFGGCLKGKGIYQGHPAQPDTHGSLTYNRTRGLLFLWHAWHGAAVSPATSFSFAGVMAWAALSGLATAQALAVVLTFARVFALFGLSHSL